MTEEAGKQEESKSEEKKDPDLTQLQEQVSQVAPLVKPLGANVLELIKSIPFIGASAAGGISFWLQQKLVVCQAKDCEFEGKWRGYSLPQQIS